MYIVCVGMCVFKGKKESHKVMVSNNQMMNKLLHRANE